MWIFRDYLKGFQAFNISEGYIQITLCLPKTAPTSWCVLYINPSGQNFSSVRISQDLPQFSALILSMLFTSPHNRFFFAVFLPQGNVLMEFIQNFGLSIQTATGDCSHWFKCNIFKSFITCANASKGEQKRMHICRKLPLKARDKNVSSLSYSSLQLLLTPNFTCTTIP